VRREVLYNILIEVVIPMTSVSLIKMCLSETYSRVLIGKHVYDMLHIKSGMKQGASSPLFFNFALEYAIRSVQVNQDDLKLNGTHQLLGYADDIVVWGRSVLTIKKNIED
jgi:hypothetical protein